MKNYCKTSFTEPNLFEAKYSEDLLAKKPQKMKAISISYKATYHERTYSTIGVQEDIIKSYSEGKNFELISYYKISGYKPEANAKFNKMIDYISKNNETIAIVFYNARVLYSIPEIYTQLLELCMAGKIEVHFVLEKLVISQNANFKELFHFMISRCFLPNSLINRDSLRSLSNLISKHKAKGI